MEDWIEFKAKTVDEALTESLIKLETTSDNVEYEVVEKDSKGIFGLFSRLARIRVRVKDTNISIKDVANKFLTKLFLAMKVDANIEVDYNEKESIININISGENMGVLIGKRGQTLDSLQYLTSLVINKESTSYIKVKLDTENYRERRKETLENLARNIAFKVKRTKQSVSLEPMNPYERRIIHSSLQNDKNIETHSEGEEPFRKVVITLKKGYKEYNANYQKKPYYKKDNKKEIISEKKNIE